MKVSFIQGLENLMTLNLKKKTLFTLVPQNLKNWRVFHRKIYGNLTLLIRSSIKLVNFFAFK